MVERDMQYHDIYGDRLRQARILRKLSGQELAAALGKTPPTVTRWENIERLHLEDDVLRRMSKSLGFPARFFTSPPMAPVADNDILFRAPKSTLKREKAYLREFSRLVGEVLRWVEVRRPLPPLLLPNLPSDTDVVAATASVRRALGQEPDRPISSLTHAVERAGVPIVRRPVPWRSEDGPGTNSDKHLGYTTWVGDFWDRPIIVTRGVPSWERTRWTVAHEVGHAVLHRSGGAIAREGTSAEDAANRFANELLAPIDAVRESLPATITLFSLVDAKAEWGISLGALIVHLSHNRLISRQRFDTLRAQLYSRNNPHTGTTFGKFEPGWDDRQPERPSMLRCWLESTVGRADPETVSAISGVWPADILKEILVEQRARGPAPRTGRGQTSTVVDLASRRIRG